MCEFKALGLSWPPRGWEQLRHIKKTTGQSVTKDPALARVAGLAYAIEPIPFYKGKKIRSIVYSIEITGWEYTIHNDSREFPVLSFLLQERPDRSAPKDFYISDLKTMAHPIRITERSVHRALMAASFMIKQINGDKVPNIGKILRLYKIHPSQRSLYDIDNARSDSLYCGLPYIMGDGKKDQSETY